MMLSQQLRWGQTKLAIALILDVFIVLSASKVFASDSFDERWENLDGNISIYQTDREYSSLESPDDDQGTKLLLASESLSQNAANSNLLSQLPQVPNNTPNPVTPVPPQQPVPTPEVPKEPPLEETPNIPPDSTPRIEIPGKITVTEFQFEGNTAFSNQQLQEEIKSFLNRPLSFAELLQVEGIITKLYTDRGYLNSGAVIATEQAPLKPEGSVVKIRIIEGGVEGIRVSGTRRLKKSYIRSRVGLGVGKPLNRDRLLEALKLIQVNPLIESISAELSSGSRPELSFLDLKINEANTFRVDVFADNGRAPSVGTFRRGISISESNTTGFGDRSFLKFTNTDGSNAYDFSYALPVNPRNGEITLGVGFSNTSVVEPPFAGRIDVNGDSNYIDVGFRQPLKQSSTEEFAVGFNFSHQESKTRIFEVGFPLSEGADDNGITRVNALRFVQEYTKRDEKQVFALRSQFSLGLGWFNSTVNKDAPDGRFLSWRGQSQYVRLLAPDTLFLVRSDLQLASRALVPLEQFGVGGLQSVRGYRQDQLLTDNGFYASTEVRFPILRMKEIKGLLQFVPFFDFGVGWNGSGKQNPDRNAFASIGAGLQFQIDDRFNARLDYGIPLTDVKSGDRTLQEQGLYFSVNYRLF